jgi:hypothetical protein
VVDTLKHRPPSGANELPSLGPVIPPEVASFYPAAKTISSMMCANGIHAVVFSNTPVPLERVQQIQTLLLSFDPPY